MATIIPIDISNTSTLNSGAVNTSENSFEELEELNSSLEIYENEESPEILGVFDTLDGPESLSGWINKKYLMLDTVIDLGRQIEELELSTLEKYSDHYDTWWKKYEDAITEIANLKGRYFQLDQPNLLESPDENLVLNPYIDHFEDSESDWVPFAYSKNEYWSWLNSQNEFIEKLGLSQQPPDISGNFENLQSSIDNAKSDRSWKIGRVNGSEFAQALIQSIDNLAKNSIDLNSYIVENNSDEDGFKYSTKSNVFGVRYVSQAPGILYSTNPGSRNGFEFDSGLSGGIGFPIPGGPFTDKPQVLENEKD